MRPTVRRVATTAGALAAATALLTGTASAHYCYFDKDTKSQRTNGQAWTSGAAFVSFIQNETAPWDNDPTCAAGRQAVIDEINALGPNVAFMGPGLLAGGTLKNGKGNTPGHMGHLDFGAVPGYCWALLGPPQ